VPYFLSHYDPDPLALYLTAWRPSTATRLRRFPWKDFVQRNNT